MGFGSGLNVPFYPGAVTRVVAIEPADVGWKLAAERLATQLSRSSGPDWMVNPSPSPTTVVTPR